MDKIGASITPLYRQALGFSTTLMNKFKVASIFGDNVKKSQKISVQDLKVPSLLPSTNVDGTIKSKIGKEGSVHEMKDADLILTAQRKGNVDKMETNIDNIQQVKTEPMPAIHITTVRPHVQSIKFPPRAGESLKFSGQPIVASSSVESLLTTPSQPPTSSGKKGPAIDSSELPLRYRRKPISLEEMEYIEKGGQV